jgi:hypothetical protein
LNIRIFCGFRKQTEKFRFYERELFHVIKAREEEENRRLDM